MENPKRYDNRWAKTLDDLKDKIIEAIVHLEGVDADGEGERISLRGQWTRGNRDDYNAAWELFKATSEALKRARIWTTYDDNTTPKDGDGEWEIVVYWHHP
jgi:hypothetical protein